MDATSPFREKGRTLSCVEREGTTGSPLRGRRKQVNAIVARRRREGLLALPKKKSKGDGEIIF